MTEQHDAYCETCKSKCIITLDPTLPKDFARSNCGTFGSPSPEVVRRAPGSALEKVSHVLEPPPLAPADYERLKQMTEELRLFCEKHRLPIFALIEMGLEPNGARWWTEISVRPHALNFEFGDGLRSAVEAYVKKLPRVTWPDGRPFSLEDALALAKEQAGVFNKSELAARDILLAYKTMLQVTRLSRESGASLSALTPSPIENLNLIKDEK